MTIDVPEILKPRWRGVLHQYAFFVAVIGGAGLVIAAEGGRARVAALVYAFGLAGLLGTSALYHRVTWASHRARMWMRRLDHSMIFVLIAGTATPISLLVLDDPLRTVLLCVAWGGTLAGVLLNLLWPTAPKWVSSVVYMAIGWSGIAALPSLASYAWTALALLAAGGVLYTAGAIIYAIGRPNPAPKVFGYHEIFHALVIVAAALHFAAVGIVVL